MDRLSGWFRSAKEDVPDESNYVENETKSLEHALECAAMIMNDDREGAFQALQDGDSTYHELGAAVTTFMRSIFGLEKQVMLETSNRLDACEARAAADIKTAQKMSAVTSIYPAGTQYELVRAETQLMGAVVGVLNESLMEAVRSFIKVRRAYHTLNGIVTLEGKMLSEREQAREVQARPVTPVSDVGSEDESSESEFEDAEEDLSREPTPDRPANSTAATTPEPDFHPESSLPLNNPIDIFIHSGANMCFGIIMLILTIVPPAFSRLLSIVGFHGDRPRGVRMLWESAAWPNVNGAIAALVLLNYYNGLLGFVDIVPSPQDYDEDAEVVGPPKRKCEKLLSDMRTRYPDSGFWRLEEARLSANQKNLAKAIEIGKSGKEAKTKQIRSLIVFELAMNSLYAQQWETMRDSFLRCAESNDWSPAMYSYLVACAIIELYRNAYHSGDAAAAKEYKAQADEYLRRVPSVASKKRMRGKQLPFEQFVQRKLAKWEARAKTLGVDLVDAIGVSPALEMSFLWNGQKRMNEGELESALAAVDWSRCTVGEEAVEKIKGEKDEMAVWALSRGVLVSRMGRLAEARQLFGEHILCHDKSVFKGGNKDDYVLPSAIYEMAVMSWFECNSPPIDVDVAAYRKEKAAECRKHMERVMVWERFVLDARIGMRVQSGMETLKWFEKKMGY